MALNLLSDIITYVRRIIKTPSNASITDSLIIDYINRFWILDVDARIQLFDLKTTYQFQTVPGYDQYNMPLYGLQNEPGGQISYYPVYQGFIDPLYINGIQVPFNNDKTTFYNIWPNIVQQMTTVAVGNGTTGPYQFFFPIAPQNTVPLNIPVQYILRGHVDIAGISAFAQDTGTLMDPPIVSNLNVKIPLTSIQPQVFITSLAADNSPILVTDSGQFLSGNQNYGLLFDNENTSFGQPLQPLTNPLIPATPYSTTSNTINYFTGEVNVNFPVPIPSGVNINAQSFFFQCGLPRAALFYNNVFYFRSPPDQQYLIQVDGYLSPAAFLSTNQALQFAYMTEYIARGAARKILSDTGDVEQFQFYEPFFKEQEILVWKRSQRQYTQSRTQTIYSQGINQGQSGFNNLGGSTL